VLACVVSIILLALLFKSGTYVTSDLHIDFKYLMKHIVVLYIQAFSYYLSLTAAIVPCVNLTLKI